MQLCKKIGIEEVLIRVEVVTSDHPSHWLYYRDYWFSSSKVSLLLYIILTDATRVVMGHGPFWKEPRRWIRARVRQFVNRITYQTISELTFFMKVLHSDGSGPKKSSPGRAQALNVKLGPSPSLSPSLKAGPRAARACRAQSFTN